MGRKKPYTKLGIRRLKCVRCNAQATHQWKVCADGLYRPICTDCDTLLNRIILMFLFPNDPVGNNNKIKQYVNK